MQKTEPKKKPIALSAAKLELIDCVIRAACEHNEVTRQQLLEDNRLAATRHICFFIIRNALPAMKDYEIGYFFNKGRTAVNYGIELVSHQKNIYRQTLDTLNVVSGIANNFTKNHQWYLPKINITL